MKLSAVKSGDKVRYRSVYCGRDTIAFGIITNEKTSEGYVSIRDLVTGEIACSHHKNDLIAVIFQNDSEGYKEEIIEHPIPLTFDFFVQEAQRSFSASRIESAWMRGMATWNEGGIPRREFDVTLPWSDCMHDMGAGGKFQVTIKKIP